MAGQLPAAGLDIDPAADADGAGNPGFVQDLARRPAARSRVVACPRIFLGRVERDHVDVADQPFQQAGQF